MPRSAPVRYTYLFNSGPKLVTVINEEHKGHHREHCLCFQGCRFFKPETSDSCSIALELFNLDVQHTVVTPVYECARFEAE